MTRLPDPTFDQRIADWLEDDPSSAPPEVLNTVLAALPSIERRRAWGGPWRMPTMFTNRLAVAGLAAVVVVAGGYAWSRMSVPEPGGPSPTPIASPTQSMAPTIGPTPDPTAILRAFTSADVGKALAAGRYQVDGSFVEPFSVTLPPNWKVSAFTRNNITIESASDGRVNVYLAVIDVVYSNPCHPLRGGRGATGISVNKLVAALTGMAGFEVTGLSDATVGGANGKTFSITNSIDVGASNCSGEKLVIGRVRNGGEFFDIEMFPGETDQAWVLDVAGTNLFMAVTDNAIAGTQSVRDSLLFGFEPTN